MDSVAETWKSIEGHAGYEVSDQGRIRSLSRTVTRIRNGKVVSVPWSGRILKTVIHRGYSVAKLGNHPRTLGVHTYVARAFIGECPPGMVIDHVNGIKTDNRPSNLEYVTNSENVRRAHRNKLMRQPRGEQHGMCRLSDDDVAAIRRNPEGKTRSELAERHGVSSGWIRQLQEGRKRA